MKLELRDLGSSESVIVPEEGLTFGRAGGDAQHVLRDAGVSKRHARIWNEGGAWFLEDLGSSNGTIFGDQRIAEAVEILPGDIFALSKVKFEVVQVVSDGAEQEDEPPPEERTPPPPPKPNKSAQNAMGKEPPGQKGAKPGPAPKKAPPKITSEEARPGKKGGFAVGGGFDEAAEAKGVGYFFIAVPKALAYYLAAIPLMLVNPIGAVRKGIEAQKSAPMGRMEIIAYAIPPLAFSAFLGSIAQGIVLAVNGHFSIMSFIPIGPAIGALIGAVVTGFIWHPLVKWWVHFLKGESNERSRTNYFLMSMTGTAVLAVPSAVGTLLGLVPFRLVGLVAVLLSAVATVAMLYIHYSWFNHFQVVKWFRTVLLVLGGLSVLGALGSGVSVLVSGPAVPIATGGSGEAPADVQAQLDAANKAAEEALKNGDAAGQDALKRIADAKAASEDAAKEAAKRAAEAKAAAERAADKPDKTPDKPEVAAAGPTPADPPVAPAEAPPAPQIAGKGYGAWKAKRDLVEKRIGEDPTLLTSVSGLLPIYRSYQARTYEIEARYAKASAKKPAEAVVNAHLRNAELYEKTDRELQQVYSKLTGR